MDSSTATKPYSKLKGGPYRAYEELPVEVRRALQEALVDWCPLRAREWHHHLLHRERLRPAQAASFRVQTIRSHDHAEVATFAKKWPKSPEAYPKLAADATLQRYVGPDGIPHGATRRRVPPAAHLSTSTRPGRTEHRRRPMSGVGDHRLLGKTVANSHPPDQYAADVSAAEVVSEPSDGRGRPRRKAVVRERKASAGEPRATRPGMVKSELRSPHALDGDTPLRIPFDNNEATLQLGARYRAGGWYAPAGADLAAFRERGWL